MLAEDSQESSALFSKMSALVEMEALGFYKG